MAEEPDTTKPGDGDESKLELPSLSFRRRKKKDKAAEEPPAETVAETPVEAETPPPPVEDATPEPKPEPTPEPTPEPEPEPTPGPEPEPEPEPAPVAEHVEDEPAERDEDEHTQVLPSAPEAAVGSDDEHRSEPRTESQPRAEKPAKAPKQPQVRKERKPLNLPPLSAPIASAVTGVVVGLSIVALVFISSRGCELVRDTGSCGRIGLVFLIAILVLAVLFGAVLLKAWQIADPINSSFLAVGLVAVIAMLFFLSYIDEWWMVIVIPAISAGTYLLAWWVTRTFIEGTDEDEAAEEPENAGSRGL